MTKLREFRNDLRAELDSFESFTKGSRYARDHNPKIDKATASKIERLTDTNAMLSQTNLALTGLLARALRFVPEHLQREYHATWDAIKNGSLTEDIHP